MLKHWCERNGCSCDNNALHVLVFVLTIITVLTVVIFHQLLVNKTSSTTKLYRIYEKLRHERYFNITVWDKDVCERMFENLRQFPKFPSYPDHYYRKNNLSSVVENTDELQSPSIKRVQFYIRPIESGLYKFRVRSSVALRISLETSPQSPEIIVSLKSSRSENEAVYSNDFLLMSDHYYYFELVLFCRPGENYFDIDWLVPGSAQFRPIESRDFMPGRHVIPSQHPLFPAMKVLSPNQHILLGFIPRIHIIKSFPPCSFVNFTTSLVTQNTVVCTQPCPPTRHVKRLVSFFMKSFQKAVPSKYPSLKMMKVESSQNSTFNLRRLLVDLELVVDGLDYKLRMSEYFFNWDNGSSIKLCRPSHYHWSHLVTLNFVHLADCHDESGTAWVHYFIENMIEILTMSLDVNFKVIITTCDEQAARSYESKLRKSGFDRYAVVLVDGVYTETRGMRAALSLVEDDDSIVVVCESRVKMPTMIVEEIRKHTFNNTMAYSPVPFQLECGYFPGSSKPVKGQWCENCRALLSLYKHDWKIVLTDEPAESSSANGTRSDGFLKDKVLSRISKFGIEIFLVKLNDLYRF